jgi:hypothetical protein
VPLWKECEESASRFATYGVFEMLVIAFDGREWGYCPAVRMRVVF